jgi:hypothetical protein
MNERLREAIERQYFIKDDAYVSLFADFYHWCQTSCHPLLIVENSPIAAKVSIDLYTTAPEHEHIDRFTMDALAGAQVILEQYPSQNGKPLARVIVINPIHIHHYCVALENAGQLAQDLLQLYYRMKEHMPVSGKQ